MNSKTDFRTLHEGFLQDIIDIIASPTGNSVFRHIENMWNQRQNNDDFNGIKYNLANSAKGLTATFPVLVTEATKVEDAVMISKAIERKAMTLLQMLFAANQISDARGAKSYLQHFHHNIDTSIDLSDMDVDDVIEYSNRIAHENAIENKLEYNAMINEAINFINEDTKKNIHHILTGELNTLAINEYTCMGTLQEMEVGTDNRISQRNETRRSEDIIDPTTNQKIGSQQISTTTSIEDDITIENIKHAYEALNKNILKTDISKANEAVPSLMVINFVSLADGHKILNTAVIGVKAVLHYVSSEDMINHIIMKNADKHGLFNFIRATTREISFFKDFLFAVDRAKIDALGRSGKGSSNKLWKILELRADAANYNRKMRRNNTDCAAITSLIINKSEVDLIKKYHRIDLMKPGQFLGIMRGYNLMCGIIIDEVAEKVDFLFDDGDANFETLSFMSLERDGDSGQLKKVINLLASKGR